LIAVGLIAIPAGIFAFLAIGELASGDITGIQHIPEAGLMLALALVAWRYPRAAGTALIAIGVLLLGFMSLVVLPDAEPSGAEVWIWPVMAVLLFGTPVLAGLLLLRSARR
jgi:hypothetical protein